jgi:hypothetical protein
VEEERHELDPGKPGSPSVNGHHVSSDGRTRCTPDESHDRPDGPPDVDSRSVGESSKAPGGRGEPSDDPGDPYDDLGSSLAQTDWETTRYLAAATQLDLSYARFVVRQIVGKPFCAVAPAAGADIVVVTRWALAALRRRARRDGVLTGLLILGLATGLGAWTWIPIAVMVASAIVVIAYERWIRDVKVLDRLMLRGRFHAHDAPVSPSPSVEKRLAVVQQEQKGNLVVFRGRSAFVGSGDEVMHERILVNVALGRQKKNGKRVKPIPFSTPELYTELEIALKNMDPDFPEIRVGQRLFVNGEHVAANRRLLPDEFGPPVAHAPPDLLHYGCAYPTSEARTYVCAEIGGWKGQLVVSLFARAVQVGGSLEVEWRFHVLPPLYANFLLIDQRYEPGRIKQITKVLITGFLWFVPALLAAPVAFTRYAVLPLTSKAQIRHESYRIRHGYVFNYGSPRSIREEPITYRHLHDFVAGDELTFIFLAEHTMLRALTRFLNAHKIDMKQFERQEQTIINKTSHYNVDKINASNVAVGNRSRASGTNHSGPSSDK